MVIKVCIGSACHLKGSYEVIKTFKSYIEKNQLEKEIELKSSFCLGRCSEAVSVEANNGELFSVAPESAQTFIEEFHKWVIK